MNKTQLLLLDPMSIRIFTLDPIKWKEPFLPVLVHVPRKDMLDPYLSETITILEPGKVHMLGSNRYNNTLRTSLPSRHWEPAKLNQYSFPIIRSLLLCLLALASCSERYYRALTLSGKFSSSSCSLVSMCFSKVNFLRFTLLTLLCSIALNLVAS